LNPSSINGVARAGTHSIMSQAMIGKFHSRRRFTAAGLFWAGMATMVECVFPLGRVATASFKKITVFKVKTDPILYVGKLEDKLTEFVGANGDYLFIVFAFLCLLAVAWLLSRPRKPLLSEPSSARTRAIIGTMLASPDMSSDADGGRARLIMGKSPSHKSSDAN
jgi:hypothetical protein